MIYSRRAFLQQQAMGVGSLALAWLMQQENASAKLKKMNAESERFDLLPKTPHHQPKAKAMISLFQHGGPSHMDLTDPKPELTRFDGTDYKEDIAYSFANFLRHRYGICNLSGDIGSALG